MEKQRCWNEIEIKSCLNDLEKKDKFKKKPMQINCDLNFEKSHNNNFDKYPRELYKKSLSFADVAQTVDIIRKKS